MSVLLPSPPHAFGRRGGRQERTGRPADEGARHPQGRNNVEDRRSRLPRAAAGLQGSDRPHRWPKAPTPARGTRADRIAGPKAWPERSDLAARPRAAISPTARQGLASKINRLPPDRHPKRHRSLATSATYLPKKRCADNRLPHRGAIPFILLSLQLKILPFPKGLYRSSCRRRMMASPPLARASCNSSERVVSFT